MLGPNKVTGLQFPDLENQIDQSYALSVIGILISKSSFSLYIYIDTAYSLWFGSYIWWLPQVYIKATGENSAEMVTDQGAIYVTSNKGYNWKAAVQETVSATLNRWA